MADQARGDTGMRLLRAVVFSVVCVVLSALGHSLVAGTAVAMWVLPVGWLVTLGLVLPLAGRRCSRPGITATLLCGQVLLHAVFCVGQGSAVHTVPLDTAAMPGMADGHGTGVQLMLTPGMFAVHLASAFVMGWVLHRGETAMWRVVDISAWITKSFAGLLALTFLLATAVRLPGAWPGALRRSETSPARLRMAALRHSVVRRGPPAVVAVA
ncbi:MAG TPA: hypothetical protein VNW94_23730 [Streptosporangiaceae bacterium]|nr:hypothetical protein [Streptosporangiaceae bacterium]